MIIYTQIVDIAAFTDDNLLHFHHQSCPLPHRRLPLPHQLDAVANGLPLAPDLYPQSLPRQP